MKFKMAEDMMSEFKAPWSTVLFQTIGSKPAIYSWRRPLLPSTFRSRMLRRIGSVVWTHSHLFGFAPYFATKPVDVIQKQVQADGSYLKMDVEGKGLEATFDRLIMVPSKVVGNAQRLTAVDIINLSIANKFSQTFAVDNPQPYIIQHPIKITMVKNMTTVPDQIVIRPHTSDGPITIDQLSIFYADEEEIIEFDTNYAYPDVKLRFGVTAAPIVTFLRSVDALRAAPMYSPTNRLGTTADASNYAKNTMQSMLPTFEQKAEGYRSGVLFEDTLIVRLKYSF
jgi:hypothetical protein